VLIPWRTIWEFSSSTSSAARRASRGNVLPLVSPRDDTPSCTRAGVLPRLDRTYVMTAAHRRTRRCQLPRFNLQDHACKPICTYACTIQARRLINQLAIKSTCASTRSNRLWNQSATTATRQLPLRTDVSIRSSFRETPGDGIHPQTAVKTLEDLKHNFIEVDFMGT